MVFHISYTEGCSQDWKKNMLEKWDQKPDWPVLHIYIFILKVQAIVVSFLDDIISSYFPCCLFFSTFLLLPYYSRQPGWSFQSMTHRIPPPGLKSCNLGLSQPFRGLPSPTWLKLCLLLSPHSFHPSPHLLSLSLTFFLSLMHIELLSFPGPLHMLFSVVLGCAMSTWWSWKLFPRICSRAWF